MTGPGHPHVVITGPMGVGKSTTAEAVGARLQRPVHDSDRDIERLLGMTGAQVVAELGVDELHRLEEAVLLGALARDEPAVICAAGWVVEDELCRRALRARATVVVLRAPVDELIRRAATEDHRRPLAAAEVEALAARRAPLYEAVADLHLDAMEPTERLADAILKCSTNS